MATPQKTAYIWGPVSSFTGPLIAWLVKKGWLVHVACKSSLNLLSLSPLDLRSAAQSGIENAFGGHDKAKAFQDKIKIVEQGEIPKGTRYDAIIFAGMPPNFDEARAPRAPWSAGELKDLLSHCKDSPLFIISSLFGAAQNDGVVPEDLEFNRRRPLTNWEGICQQYESRLLEKLSKWEAPWYLVRLPLISGATEDGFTTNYSGLYGLLKELSEKAAQVQSRPNKEVRLHFNPNATLWFLPVDTAVYTFWRFLEDEHRTRILNLIPTNATLNMEWLQSIGKALSINLIEDDEDRLEIAPVLRKLLNDNIMVKNRNLFEVAGRYHIPPVQIDEQYFDKIIKRASANNWGEASGTIARKETSISYSDRLARFYFEEFLQELLNTGTLLDKAIAQGHSIGFIMKEAGDLRWHVKRNEGQTVLARYEPSDERPQICFKLSGQALVNLIQSKVPLHRALLLRWVEVEGPVLETLKVTNLVERFFKENPVHAERLNKLQLENVTAF